MKNIKLIEAQRMKHIKVGYCGFPEARAKYYKGFTVCSITSPCSMTLGDLRPW